MALQSTGGGHYRAVLAHGHPVSYPYALRCLAVQLGFEHHVVEVWRQWTPEPFKAFVDYANARHVGSGLWKHSRDLQKPEARRACFTQWRDLGVVGVKIDFLDHEAREVVDGYQGTMTIPLRDGGGFAARLVPREAGS